MYRQIIVFLLTFQGLILSQRSQPDSQKELEVQNSAIQSLKDEINATKNKLGLPIKQFYLPKEVIENFQQRFPDLMYLSSSWKDHWRSQRKNKDLRSILDATIGI